MRYQTFTVAHWLVHHPGSFASAYSSRHEPVSFPGENPALENVLDGVRVSAAHHYSQLAGRFLEGANGDIAMLRYAQHVCRYMFLLSCIHGDFSDAEKRGDV